MRITSRGKSVLAAGVIVASVATAALVAAPGVQGDSTPDWTIAPCSFDFRPGMTRTVTLPAYTMTDRCVQPDGQITISDSFKVVEVFPAD